MAIAIYNPEEVVVVVGGVYTLSGLQSGTFISVSPQDSQYKTSVSADGKPSRTHIENPLFDINITLTSTSEDNKILSLWAFADGKARSMFLPLMIKDGTGSTVFFTPMCWIETYPSVTFSEGVEGREWTLTGSGGGMLVGGNEGTLLNTSLATMGFFAADRIGLF